MLFRSLLLVLLNIFTILLVNYLLYKLYHILRFLSIYFCLNLYWQKRSANTCISLMNSVCTDTDNIIKCIKSLKICSTADIHRQLAALPHDRFSVNINRLRNISVFNHTLMQKIQGRFTHDRYIDMIGGQGR